MLNLLRVAVGAVLVLVIAGPVSAQLKGTATSRVRMVRAICTTGPCAPAFNFRTGSTQIKKLRQPKPMTDRDIGRMRLDGVSTTGPSLPASLDGQITARVNYDTVDPDSDCVAVGTDVTQVIATSSLSCTQKGSTTTSCRGDVVLVSGVLDDPDCTDVQVFISDLLVEVFEDGGVGDDAQKLAQNGILGIGKTPDCDSGGAGCP